MSIPLRTLPHSLRRRLHSAIKTMSSPDLPLTTKLQFIFPPLGQHEGSDARTLGFPDGKLYLTEASRETDRNVVWDVYVNRCYSGDYGGATVIDIGAHKGYFGAYAVMHGAQRVISYEPEAENFRLLNATAQSFAGRASQWERRRAAVCATSGEVELQVDPASWAHAVSSFKPGAAGPQHASQTVASTSMQDVLAGVTSNGTAGRLIVKIDAEGAECEIVMETSVDLWRLVDEIYVEIHDFAACGPSQIAEYLRRAGFDFVSDQFGVLRMRKPTPG